MGPYNEDRQIQRAGAIERLLKNNPQLDDVTRAMWERKLKELALNETTYNYRVKTVYGNFTRSMIWQEI